MARVELTQEEAGAIEEILRSYLSDLRMEIGDTNRKAFRDDLKRKEAFLKSFLDRLRGA